MKKVLIVLLVSLVALPLFAFNNRVDVSGSYGGLNYWILEDHYEGYIYGNSVPLGEGLHRQFRTFGVSISGANYFLFDHSFGLSYSLSFLFPQYFGYDWYNEMDMLSSYTSFGLNIDLSYKLSILENLDMDFSLGIGVDYFSPDYKPENGVNYNQSTNFFLIHTQAAVNYAFARHFSIRAGLDLDIPFMFYSDLLYQDFREEGSGADIHKEEYVSIAGIGAYGFISLAFLY
ncbi:MAG TPA: hypothetical protein IAB12_07170 [Candidatus Ornithospirochaeta avicola]|uniref:Outer membrane protein beta-barrel domain-containing protein n=1 Tax=Candidatus Ornithospirochaeta avicola TaxID=2840896 RepID=A0A9D1TNP3_9SPIO|nr:hypothetical protein [Candidatus Ornithospirochaeta avicola]